MCETSNTPAPVRTATCSWRMPSYWTGISQPANGTSLAPARSWRSNSGVRRRVSAAGGNRPQVTPCEASGRPALRRAPALVHGHGEAQPSREGEIRRMLGAQYAADAIGLQDELDVRGDGFGW